MIKWIKSLQLPVQRHWNNMISSEHDIFKIVFVLIIHRYPRLYKVNYPLFSKASLLRIAGRKIKICSWYTVQIQGLFGHRNTVGLMIYWKKLPTRHSYRTRRFWNKISCTYRIFASVNLETSSSVNYSKYCNIRYVKF